MIVSDEYLEALQKLVDDNTPKGAASDNDNTSYLLRIFNHDNISQNQKVELIMFSLDKLSNGEVLTSSH